MRRFHSYGPVNEEYHFSVSRKNLVHSCLDNLIGDPEKGGHYFTVWAPRQTGKTWIIYQVKKIIEICYQENFSVHCFSLGDLRGMRCEPSGGVEIPTAFADVLETGLPGNPMVKTWKEFRFLFSKNKGLWKKPLILFIDEVDTAPPGLLDLIVGRFREMYLDRSGNFLHGLALVGVRAVLGADSEGGSPFNIQKSLHVPNLTWEEVEDLFRQYQDESGQKIEPEVVQNVFDASRGQPGLIGWFGELLTEKYNPGKDAAITMPVWETVYQMSIHREWNNTILNLIKKAQGKYVGYVTELFTRSDLPFSIRSEWCNYLYLNGVIDESSTVDKLGKQNLVCRFSSPFVQHCLFDTLTMNFIGDRMPILALEPTDDISDILKAPELDMPGLMERYKAYLKRLKAKGLNPWRDQPRRKDMHLTEAVGHFHLYAWLQNALGRLCTISPEFPTGNGRVDLHIRCDCKSGMIEVKSFTDLAEMESIRTQAASYAESLSMSQVTIALFAPVEDERVLNQLSGETVINHIRVTVAAIGWA